MAMSRPRQAAAAPGERRERGLSDNLAAADGRATRTTGAETTAAEVRPLPEAMRRELPPLNVSGAAYSANKANRMLLANGQVFHEGDSVAEGLVLQQIKPRGAVFSFKGYRYELPF